MPFKVQLSPSKYRIVGPSGEEGEAVSYEEIATLKLEINGKQEIFYCDATEDPDAEEQTVERVGTSFSVETETEDILLPEDPDEEGEEGEEGDDDEDEGEFEDEPGPELVA